jgi:hypothetical protein
VPSFAQKSSLFDPGGLEWRWNAANQYDVMLPLARMTGSAGRIVVVDIQTRMLDSLRRRAFKAGLLTCIETRLTQPDSMGIGDLRGAVDWNWLNDRQFVSIYLRYCAGDNKAY